MKTVSIHDAKTNLSKYIAAAKKGEKVYIGGFGKPEVVLVKLTAKEHESLHQRLFQAGKGKLTPSADAFTAITDGEVADLMFDN